MAGKVGRVKLGSQGLEVSRQGFGCMGMTAFYGKVLTPEQGLELLTKAYEQGITFWETAQVYAGNEELLSGAIKALGRHNLQIASKTGIFAGPQGVFIDGSPESIKRSCQESLDKLGVECIDLYYLHRIDQGVPIEVSMGAMKELVQEGKIKYVGLSECSAATLRRAHAVHPITAVQMEWSLWSRDIEQELVPLCKELGVGIVAYSPLGRGFLTGSIKSQDGLAPDDFRRALPRFADDAIAHNSALVDRFLEVAKEQGMEPARLALAWVHHQEAKLGGAGVVPIPGTTKLDRVQANAEAAFVQLSEEVVAKCESAIPPGQVMGGRYAPGMAVYDEDNNPKAEASQ